MTNTPDTINRLKIAAAGTEDDDSQFPRLSAALYSRKNSRDDSRSSQNATQLRDNLIARFSKLYLLSEGAADDYVDDGSTTGVTFTLEAEDRDNWDYYEVSPKLLVDGTPENRALKEAVQLSVNNNWETLLKFGNTDKNAVIKEFMNAIIKVSARRQTIRKALLEAISV